MRETSSKTPGASWTSRKMLLSVTSALDRRAVRAVCSAAAISRKPSCASGNFAAAGFPRTSGGIRAPLSGAWITCSRLPMRTLPEPPPSTHQDIGISREPSSGSGLFRCGTFRYTRCFAELDRLVPPPPAGRRRRGRCARPRYRPRAHPRADHPNSVTELVVVPIWSPRRRLSPALNVFATLTARRLIDGH